VAAGAIAGLAAGPFVPPFAAVFVGLLAGGTVPFVTFAIDRILRLNDVAGVVVMAGVPAIIGLISVGIFADGVMGSGWQRMGMESYLDVAGQGVSGLFVANGYQMDFPGQLQAQIIGAVTLSLWGFITGTLVCAPLAVFYHGVEIAAKASVKEVEQPQVVEEALPQVHYPTQPQYQQPTATDVQVPQAEQQWQQEEYRQRYQQYDERYQGQEQQWEQEQQWRQEEPYQNGYPARPARRPQFRPAEGSGGWRGEAPSGQA
jgi:hypothetical protein